MSEESSAEFVQNLYELSPGSEDALRIAKEEALKVNHAFINTEHLLLGLTGQKEQPTIANVLAEHGLNSEALRKALLEAWPRGDRLVMQPVRVTPRTLHILDYGKGQASSDKKDEIYPIHLLEGCLEEGVSSTLYHYLFTDPEDFKRVQAAVAQLHAQLRKLS